MLLIGLPEIAHLPEDHTLSAESFVAPLQFMINCLKWIPIFETVQRVAVSKVIY
jgi:hypothetical protein